MQHEQASNAKIGSNRRRPNYAIVHLPEDTNVVNFYQLLLENGFPEVSFVNEVRENAFLPSLSNTNTNTNGKNNNNNNSNYIVQQQQNQPINNTKNNGYNSEKSTTSMPVLSMANVLEGARALLRQHQQQLSTGVQHLQSRDGRVIQAALPVQQLNPQCKFVITSPSILAVKTTSVDSTPKPNLVSNNPVILNSSSPAESQSSSLSLNQTRTTNVPITTETEAIATSNNTISNNGSDEYATCLLCNNRLMSTRLSNLTNHVRRHATMKQYRCRHCTYSHNEMAKVRLHMSHNHHDFDSQPVDQLTFEMQLQWGLLMEQCFPEHAKRFGPSAANSQFRCLDQLQKCVDLDRSYTCIECGELVQGYRLANHLEETHSSDCAPSACDECGYESSSQWKVRLHISVKHPERAADVPVKQLPAGSNWMLFIHKFFSDVHIPALEAEEASLVAELREKNTDFEHLNDDNNQVHDLFGDQEIREQIFIEKSKEDYSSTTIVGLKRQTESSTKSTHVDVDQIGCPIDRANDQINSGLMVEKQKNSEKEALTPNDHTQKKKHELIEDQTQRNFSDKLDSTKQLNQKAEENKTIMKNDGQMLGVDQQQQQKNTSIDRNLRKRECFFHNDDDDNYDQSPVKRHNLRQSHRLIEQQKQKQQKQNLNHNSQKHYTERPSSKVEGASLVSGSRKK